MRGQAEAIREVMEEAAGEDVAPLIWICRNIPGDHCGGPTCWCSPRVIAANDEAAAVAVIEAGIYEGLGS